jgi:hypothetical protein
MKQGEIIYWLMQRISFINKIPERITKVTVYNEMTHHIGKMYNRIYFDIDTDVDCTYMMPENDAQIEANRISGFLNYESKKFISFYQYNNEEVKVHYYWIVEFLRAFLDSKIECSFKSYSN